MKKLFTLLFLAVCISSNAQNIKSFMYAPDSLMEAGSCKLLHHGYIVTGKYYAHGSYVNYTIRYNNDGSIKWTRQESAGHIRALVDVAEDEKGNLFFIGEDPAGYAYYTLIKTDSLGNFAWSLDLDKTAFSSYGNPRLLCDQSGYIYALSSTYEKTHLFKLKTTTGLLVWSRTFDIDFVTEKNPGFDMVLTGDKGVICTGKADSDIFMVCVSPWGNLNWCKRMNDFGNSYAHAKCITRLQDGNYLIAGYRGENTVPFLSGIFLLKIDSLGTILKYKFYYDSLNLYSFVPENIHELPNSTIRVTGNGGPLTIADFDASLNLVNYAYWTPVVNTQTTSNCFDMNENTMLITGADRVDKQYILYSLNAGDDFCQMGSCGSYELNDLAINESLYTSAINFGAGPGAVSSSCPLFAVTPYTHTIYCGNNELYLSQNEIDTENNNFTAYPNPVEAGNNLNLKFQAVGSYQYMLYNASGAVLRSEKLVGISGTVSTNDLAPGVYILHVKTVDGDFIKSEKISVR